MINVIEIKRRQDTVRVARYPWNLLAAEGDVLLLHGDGLFADAAQQAAGTWARRHHVLFLTHSFRRPRHVLVVVRGA